VISVGRGQLIVFEGGEGAGKSTQLRRLADALATAQVPHRTFREPGGTPLGDRIRELLLHAEHAVTPRAEAALFVASRAQLVAAELQPALARGEMVLLDRFLLSTYAYQIHGRGLPEAPVRAANALATDGLVPDLTLLFVMDPATGLARAGARGATDRIERSEAAFHARVASAFTTFSTAAWQATHPECGPIIAIDGTGDEATVAGRVREAVIARFPSFAPALGASA
jgi:dTMP kinase